MKNCFRFVALALCLALAGASAQPAHAQLGKLKKKAQQAAGKVAGKATDAAVDRSADKAADAAVDKVDDLFGGSEEAASQEASGGATGGGTVYTSGGSAGGPGAGSAAAANALGSMMAGAGGGGAVETVDFRELRALLPESLPRLNRTDARGEKSAAFGISTSNATGSYAADNGDENIEIQITDMGSMRSFAIMGYNWATTEMDVETDRGYERTVKYKGYPGFEKFERDGGWSSAELQVVVGERFLVNVEGSDVSMEDVKAALDQIDLAKLESMKDYGLGAGIEPMDFQALKNLLPASIAGLEQTNATGQKSNAMGVNSSYAEATYNGEGASIRLKITDLGSLQGFGAMGYGWFGGSMETETDTGYERTGDYKGYRSHERFEQNGSYSSAQMDIAVNQRYVISAEGNGVTMDQIKAAIDSIDVSQLQMPEPAE